MKPHILEIFTENAKELKVLYVGDHAGTRFKCGRFLKNYFKEVVITQYPDIALTMFNSGYYDFIITDANLPEISIITFCKKVRKTVLKKPIVLTSHKKDPDILVKLINIGISGYIETPSNINQVIEVLYRVTKELMDYKYAHHDELVEKFNLEEKKFKDKPISPKNENSIDNLLEPQDVELLRMSHADMITDAKTFFEELDDSFKEDIEDLQNVLKELNETVELLDIHNSSEKLHTIAKLFGEVSSACNMMLEFSSFSSAMRSIATFIEGLREEDIDKVSEISSIMLPPIARDLIRWKEQVFVRKEASDIHYLDSSLFSSILQYKMAVVNSIKDIEEDEDDYGVEFF